MRVTGKEEEGGGLIGVGEKQELDDRVEEKGRINGERKRVKVRPEGWIGRRKNM